MRIRRLTITLLIIGTLVGAYYYSTQRVTTTPVPFEIVGNVDHFDGSVLGRLAIYVNVGGGGLAPVLVEYETFIVTTGYESMYCLGLQHVGSNSNIAKICLGDYIITYVTHTATSDIVISMQDTTTNTRTP